MSASAPWLVLLLLVFTVIAFASPNPTEARSLDEDGRIGVLGDVQGTVLVRPAGRTRWTPLAATHRVFPGDVLRSELRGAHLASLDLVGGGAALLGPGSLLEVRADGALRLLRGELEVQTTPKRKVQVLGAGDFSQEVAGSAWFRAADTKTTMLDKAPRWATGYRENATDEWMGALVAKIDGRDVPLAVGTHAVVADIKDQIARTTVEQTFINGTKDRLEGVFYFPLPADASISGFAMWIGGEMVEADIVERERARQIYEDILRRKKDPGLLEWEGGNLFKARVFPIEPFSEKRIRIRYTQVLPMEGDTYRYRYALRSELLRSKPLRKLSVEVRVASAQPLGTVASPSHEIVREQTAGEARARYDAEEVTPERDFELAIQTKSKAPLVAIPHRRGDDGYFAIQFSPPDESASGWQRTLVPEGDPLDLLFIADTSGSMDTAARERQAAFIDGMLALLGPKDRFRLLRFDADVSWLIEEPTSVTAAHRVAAGEALASVRSLGWSDIDAGLTKALEATTANTTVIYVGDGIGTTGDADPAALADRIRALATKTQATVHAVAPASTYEKGVLEAMASIGGGSSRTLDASPVVSASALLGEVARPSVKDLRVRIEGIQTARVYPTTLPNLPLGHQQVLLGRYLPSSEAQTGTITIEGTLNGKPVVFEAPITVPASDGGNSFLPRLWARRHLDALLAQGRTPEVQQEIVEFSERFGIMTPFTSFLVLESDEDRERYGVARRVRMRDGERFFASAGDRVKLELERKALQNAGQWRAGLRRPALLEIADLGRSLPIHDPRRVEDAVYRRDALSDARRGAGLGVGGGAGGSFQGRGGSREKSSGAPKPRSVRALRASGADRLRDEGEAWGSANESARAPAGLREPSDAALPPARAQPMGPTTPSPSPMADLGSMDGPVESTLDEVMKLDADFEEAAFEGPARYEVEAAGRSFARVNQRRSRRDRRSITQSALLRFNPYLLPALNWPTPEGKSVSIPATVLGFPALPSPPTLDADKPDDPEWTPEILSLLQGLDRRARVLAEGAGFKFVLVDRTQHATRARILGGSTETLWVTSEKWLHTRHGLTGAPLLASFDGTTRLVLHRGSGLARSRDAAEGDATAWSFPVSFLTRQGALARWRAWNAAVVADGDMRTVTFTREGTQARYVLRIDAARGVVVEERSYQGERFTGMRRATAFHEAGGAWWPKTIEVLDADERVTRTSTLSVEALDPSALDQPLTQAGAEAEAAVRLHGPLPLVEAARQTLAESPTDRIANLVLAIHYHGASQHDEKAEHLDRYLMPMKTRLGAQWMYLLAAWHTRSGDTFRAMLSEIAGRGAGEGADAAFGAYWRANGIWNFAARRLGVHERLALLNVLDKTLEHPALPAPEVRDVDVRSRRITLLEQSWDYDTAAAQRAQLTVDHPTFSQVHTGYAQMLWNEGQRKKATGHLEQAALKQEPWLAGERNSLFQAWTNMLWEDRRLDALEAALAIWLGHEPTYAQPYTQAWSAAMFRGRIDAAEDQVEAVLTGDVPNDLREAPLARLTAALQVAQGQGWNWSLNRILPRWTPLLGAFCRQHAMHPHARVRGLVDGVLNHYRFRRTQVWRDTLIGFAEAFLADDAIATLPHADLSRYVSFLGRWWGNPALSPEARDRAIQALRARHDAEEDEGTRSALAGIHLRLLDGLRRPDQAIAFVRARLARATKPQKRMPLARDLWSRILRRPGSDEAVRELFSLLPDLLPAHVEQDLRRARAGRDLRSLAAKIMAWELTEALGDRGELQKLSREARALKQREAQTAARAATVAHLKVAAQDAPEVARPWIASERLGYAAEWGADLDAVHTEAMGVLERAWPRSGDPLDRVLRERAAAVLAHVCTRRAATEAWKDEAGALLRRGLKAQAEAGDVPPLMDWHFQLFRFQLAVDRAEPLMADLTSWIVPGKVEARWRVALGYLHAGAGDLSQAVTRFESVENMNDLLPSDLHNLAQWYLVLERDADRDRTLDLQDERSSEWALANQIRAALRALGRHGTQITDIDARVLRRLRILMAKAGWPGNHVGLAIELYTKTKDHRALTSLVGAITGHTRESTYGFLQTFANVTRNIHEEATCDAMIAELESLRSRKEETLSDTDRRALHLFTALIEARASKVQGADPVHAKRALDALIAARQGTWADGEVLAMANFLGALRYGADALAFRAEQLAQLAALRGMLPETGATSLAVALAWARCEWAYERRDEATGRLQVEIQRARRGGALPTWADGAFNELISWERSRGHFQAAERLIKEQSNAERFESRRMHFQGLLATLYAEALRRGGRTALGSDRELFDAVRADWGKRLEADARYFGTWLQHFIQFHQSAQTDDVRRARQALLLTWARTAFPELVTRFPLHAGNHAGTLAAAVAYKQGVPQAHGIEVLLDHADREGPWIHRVGADVWSRQHYTLSGWRRYAGRLDTDLGNRLWAMVAKGLETHLRSGSNTGRNFWRRGSSTYWRERERDMIAVGSGVLELDGEVTTRRMRVARFFWNLHQFDMAIEALWEAHEREPLAVRERAQLTDWLLHQKDWDRALTLATSLVTEVPGKSEYRGHKFHALVGQGRRKQAIAGLQAFERWLRRKKQWTERPVSRMAKWVDEAGFHPEAVSWWREAIALRTEARGRRGGRDSRIADWYRRLARVLAKTGAKEEAMDAISAALVAGGTNRGQVQSTVSTLGTMLRTGKTVDSWLVPYDARVERDGLDAPVFRKAFAKAYTAGRAFRKALRQWQLAVELAPGDAEIHAALIRTHDELDDREGAVEALFGAMRLAPHETRWYLDLYKRYTDLDRPEQAERALTGLVELLPNQADGHRALATERERQERFEDAAVQWAQVARTDRLDPEGYLSYARVLLGLGRKAEARSMIEKVLAGEWERRFRGVKDRAAELLPLTR